MTSTRLPFLSRLAALVVVVALVAAACGDSGDTDNDATAAATGSTDVADTTVVDEPVADAAEPTAETTDDSAEPTAAPVDEVDTVEATTDTATCEDTAALFVSGGSVNPQLADPFVAATCEGGELVISSNGIPDYTYIQTSPGDPAAQDYTFAIPAEPVVADEPSDVALLGPIAIALNGVPIYGPTEGTGGDVLSLTGALSECGSHNGPTGFHIHLFGTSTTTDCMFTVEEVAAEPQLLGYAFDGYPIYTGNDQYTSSWQLTDESLFATDTWAAHSYVEGSGDLDECNGLVDENGDYAYYTTDTFPYVLGCYTGVVDPALTEGPGGRGGPPGG